MSTKGFHECLTIFFLSFWRNSSHLSKNFAFCINYRNDIPRAINIACNKTSFICSRNRVKKKIVGVNKSDDFSSLLKGEKKKRSSRDEIWYRFAAKSFAGKLRALRLRNVLNYLEAMLLLCLAHMSLVFSRLTFI